MERVLPISILCGACGILLVLLESPPPPAAFVASTLLTVEFDRPPKQFQVFLDADGDPSTGYGGRGWDLLVRGVERTGCTVDSPVDLIWLRRTTGGGGPGGWGEALMAVRYSILGNAVTVELPIGPGPIPWLAEIYADGVLIDTREGSVQGDPFDTPSDCAWCVRGPDVEPWDGCDVFDMDGDGDVDLGDFAKWVRDG